MTSKTISTKEKLKNVINLLTLEKKTGDFITVCAEPFSLINQSIKLLDELRGEISREKIRESERSIDLAKKEIDRLISYVENEMGQLIHFSDAVALFEIHSILYKPNMTDDKLKQIRDLNGRFTSINYPEGEIMRLWSNWLLSYLAIRLPVF
jgi:hypothetical protein